MPSLLPLQHSRGGVSCLLVCTRGGVVLLERLYPGESSLGAKAVWRAALLALSAPRLPFAREEEEQVALHEAHSVVWLSAADLLVFAAGCGDGLDELTLSAVVQGALAALRAATAKAGALSVSSLLEPHAFARACVLVDELLCEGVLETTDPDTQHSGVKLKLPLSQ